MDEKFMKLVARALYVLFLAVITDYPYTHHGDKIDAVMLALQEFYDPMGE